MVIRQKYYNNNVVNCSIYVVNNIKECSNKCSNKILQKNCILITAILLQVSLFFFLFLIFLLLYYIQLLYHNY